MSLNRRRQVTTVTGLYLHEQVKGEGGLRPTHHLFKGYLLQREIDNGMSMQAVMVTHLVSLSNMPPTG